MSMNINSQTVQKNIVLEQNKSKTQPSAIAQAKTSSVTNDDSVQITEQALNLNKMQAKTTEPKVNAHRIESLKAAILNGDYKINTERLAEKLNKFEGDFSKAFS